MERVGRQSPKLLGIDPNSSVFPEALVAWGEGELHITINDEHSANSVISLRELQDLILE